MKCNCCGSDITNGSKFCPNCGSVLVAPIQNNNNQYTTNNQYNSSMPNNNQPTAPKKSSSAVWIILAIVFVFIISIFVIAYNFFVLIFKEIDSISSNKLVCKSNNGNITIIYNDNNIIGYSAFNMSYDMSKEKLRANEIGIDNYILEYKENFINKNSGTCEIIAKQDDNNIIDDDNNINDNYNDNYNNDNNYNNGDTKIVGEDKYGYVTVPSNWGKFYDVDGSSAIQYSYANIYIVSLDYIKDTTYTAKEYASSFMLSKKEDSEVTNVTGATVQIGKDKKYTAYQVYMYYPADQTFLVTYWFDAEDGKTHYISLEGPSNISNYTYIAESFSLNK